MGGGKFGKSFSKGKSSKGDKGGKGVIRAISSKGSFSSKGSGKSSRERDYSPPSFTRRESFSSKGKGKSSKGKGKSFRESRERDHSPPRSKGKGFKGKGKKGKGKGKKGKFRSAPLDSDFWVEKENDENRQVLTGPARTGVIMRYRVQQGWGFITPDEPDKLPKKVKTKLEEAAAALEERGKEVTDPFALYFRKPDVNHEEGFRLTEDIPVTFQVYVDDKGAGACDVSPV